MTSPGVREAGTLRGVSPRNREQLSAATLAKLRAAQASIDTAEKAHRNAIADACNEASVRVVATALGVSPTTVQKWKTEAR